MRYRYPQDTTIFTTIQPPMNIKANYALWRVSNHLLLILAFIFIGTRAAASTEVNIRNPPHKHFGSKMLHMSQTGPLVATPVKKISVAKASAGGASAALSTKELRQSAHRNKDRKTDENEVDNLRLMTIARSRRLINACMGKACGKNGPGKFGYFEPQHLYKSSFNGSETKLSRREHPADAAMAIISQQYRTFSSRTSGNTTQNLCFTHGSRHASKGAAAPAPPLQAWDIAARTDGDESLPFVGRSPNVIVIFLDDAGFADIRANVNGPPSRSAPLTSETPQLDALTSKSLRMTNFHVSAATCTPSRASLLSGRTQQRLNLDGVFSQSSTQGIPHAEITIPELLRHAAYRTAMAGKWHLGWNKPFHPAFQGFDKVMGIPYSHDMGCLDPWTDCAYSSKAGSHNILTQACKKKQPLTWDFGYQEKCAIGPESKSRWNREWPGMSQLHNVPPVALFESSEFCREKLSSLNVSSARQVHPNTDKRDCNADIVEQPVDVMTLSDQFADFSEAFINAPKAETQGRPFFLYLASHLLHSPLMPARRFQLSSSKASIYGDAMAELDNLVRRLMEAVDKANATNDTLTIFTSDNGPWINDRNAPWLPANQHLPHIGSQVGPYTGGGKFTAFEGGHRMPALFHWPGIIEPGVSRAIVSSMDILPTLATLAGLVLPADRGYDGADVLPVLLSRESEAVRHQHHGALVVHFKNSMVVLVGPRWKVWLSNNFGKRIGAQGLPHQDPTDHPVFDLDADPGESNPICIGTNNRIGTMKPLLIPSDIAWVRAVGELDGVIKEQNSTVDVLSWWDWNGCKKLKEIAGRAAEARKCDERGDNQISVRSSGMNPRKAPACSGSHCYPCCNEQNFDCRCGNGTARTGRTEEIQNRRWSRANRKRQPQPTKSKTKRTEPTKSKTKRTKPTVDI